jgi:hypothetical protein
MLLRQQLENSALPNAFKRSHLISPHWDDVLLEMKRTVKVMHACSHTSSARAIWAPCTDAAPALMSVPLLLNVAVGAHWPWLDC